MKMGKIEWGAILICEIVFGALGAVFTALGVIFGMNIEAIAASPNSHGNVYIIPWVFCGVGFVCLLVFAALFFAAMKRKARRKQLIENGSCLYARVTEVKQDYFVQINTRHPYFVICEGRDPYTGETLTFRSSNVLEDPSHLLGQHLRVFIDHKNPKNYYVEINRNYGD